MDFTEIAKGLSLVDYFDYIGGHANLKCVEEGEEVLNAGHIILCGVTKCDDKYINIYALCNKTTDVDSNPHEIRGVFEIKEPINITSMVCSCKTGNSGKCKHISAVLIWCTRENLNDLEEISEADIKKISAGREHMTEDKYKPVPISEMPYFKDRATKDSFKKPSENIKIDEEKIRQFFIDRLPNSALAKHSIGARKTDSVDSPSGSKRKK